MSAYRLSPTVRWAVERFTLRLTDARGQVAILGYPDAAIWDLLSRGYPYPKVVSMMTHIAGLDEGEASSAVRSAISAWVKGGFLQESPD